MRQMLIKKPSDQTDVSYDSVKIRAKEDGTMRPGLNIVYLDFRVETMYNTALKFRYDLPESLASKGCLLLGAYDDGSQLKTLIYCLDKSVDIKKDETVLLGTAYETILLRVTESFMPTIVNVDEPKPVPKTKKKKKTT